MDEQSCDNIDGVVIAISPYTGHCYKLCPFSDVFFSGWEINTSPVASGTNSLAGNSYNFPYGGRESGAIQTTYDYTMYGNAVYDAHPTTGGKMVTKSRGGGATGWMCMDNNCPHFIQTGQRYFEV
jgi:hypothetical protein